MKNVATALVIIFIELLVGTLFLVGILCSRTDNYNLAVVENNNLSKMAEIVSIMFNEDIIRSNVAINDNEEDINDSQEDKLNKEENKEDYLTEYNTEDTVKVKEEVSYIETEDNDSNEENDNNVLNTYVGTLTGYGPDCSGCSGSTASGYYVGNTITYEDPIYGTVRIVAADKSIPFYSIVRISNVPGMETITAIVLDTGGSVGFGKSTLFDLLFSSESSTINKTYNVTFEILRWGGA